MIRPEEAKGCLRFSMNDQDAAIEVEHTVGRRIGLQESSRFNPRSDLPGLDRHCETCPKSGGYLTNENSGLGLRIHTDTTFEPHFSIGDLAVRWKLSRETVRQLVKNDPGVVKIRNGPAKTMTRYSIPESAARRIHARLFNPADER